MFMCGVLQYSYIMPGRVRTHLHATSVLGCTCVVVSLFLLSVSFFCCCVLLCFCRQTIIQWAVNFITGGAVFVNYEQVNPDDAFGKTMIANLEVIVLLLQLE